MACRDLYFKPVADVGEVAEVADIADVANGADVARVHVGQVTHGF